MIKEIISFISNVNIGYACLVLLFLIGSLLFLSKRETKKIFMEIYLIIYVFLAWTLFYFFNDMINSIFMLKYLSVKSYLILLIIGNIIMLVNINKEVSKPYFITNCIMFGCNVVIFLMILLIIVFNNYSNFLVLSFEDISKLIDINMIVFIVYLNVMCLIYIIRYLVKERNNVREVIKVEGNVNRDSGIVREDNIVEQDTGSIKREVYEESSVNIDNGFYIDGVDCSIIFDDIDENTARINYYILLNDVNAKLVNGYTLKENIKIRDILNKLGIKDLNNVRLDVNQLSKISIDEYNLLKRYLGSK